MRLCVSLMCSLPSIANPIEQGLKHNYSRAHIHQTLPSIANPIEQGLKLSLRKLTLARILPSIANPIEQGLKLVFFAHVSAQERLR